MIKKIDNFYSIIKKQDIGLDNLNDFAIDDYLILVNSFIFKRSLPIFKNKTFKFYILGINIKEFETKSIFIFEDNIYFLLPLKYNNNFINVSSLLKKNDLATFKIIIKKCLKSLHKLRKFDIFDEELDEDTTELEKISLLNADSIFIYNDSLLIFENNYIAKTSNSEIEQNNLLYLNDLTKQGKELIIFFLYSTLYYLVSKKYILEILNEDQYKKKEFIAYKLHLNLAYYCKIDIKISDSFELLSKDLTLDNLEMCIDLLINFKFKDQDDKVLKDKIYLNFNKDKRKITRKLFLIKNRSNIYTIFFLSLIFIAFSFSSMKKALKPPVSSNLNNKEIIELFYSSFNKMDGITMNALTIKKAGRNLINNIDSFMIIAKTRFLYSESYNTFLACKNEKSKEIKIEEVKKGELFYNVYGICDLTIKELDIDKFQVTYNYYYSEKTEKEFLIYKTKIINLIKLELKNQNYFISNIKKLNEDKEIIKYRLNKN